MPRRIKTDPTPGVTSLNQRNKDVEFICGENDSDERSRAIVALLFSILFAIYTIIGWYPYNKIQVAESREPFQLAGYKGSLWLNLKPVYLMLLAYL